VSGNFLTGLYTLRDALRSVLIFRINIPLPNHLKLSSSSLQYCYVYPVHFALYGTQMFITLFTRAHYLTLSWRHINPINTLPSCLFNIHLTIILPSSPRSSKCVSSPYVVLKNLSKSDALYNTSQQSDFYKMSNLNNKLRYNA
jgi:hypothetical protein